MNVVETLNFGWSKKLRLVRQTEAAECGIACLAMIADWHGFKMSLQQLRSQCDVSVHGVTLARLVECANELHLGARALHADISELKHLATPCVLHWDMNHFVVLNKVNRNSIEIYDPASGVKTLPLSKVSDHYTGVALELSPNHKFVKKDIRDKIRLKDLIGKTIGFKSSLLRIFLFACVLELLMLIGPLINQLVIDEVLVGLDISLLTLIIFAMLIVAFMEAMVGLARDWCSIYLAVNFNMQWTANVFNHLVRLPIDWFHKRAIGDISAKFDSVNVIQSMITNNIIQAILDAILVVVTLVVMLIYSPALTSVSVITAAIYALLRVTWFDAFRKAEENTWEASTREQSHFLETVQGMTSLRINGSIMWRENTWRNLNVNRRNAQLHENKLAMIYGLLNKSLISISSVTVLWLGANAVLAGTFSIGMFIAFTTFQLRFSTSISSLIDKVFQYRMLSVYNERLADIVLTKKEPSFDREGIKLTVNEMAKSISSEEEDLGAVVEVEKVSFGYSRSEKKILDSVSFSISSDEVVALVGKSGGGKTTLAKLLLGLYKPNKGTIRLFGEDIAKGDMAEIRKKVGTVFQDDQVFNGSILENISFFSQQVDLEHAVRCAQLANIHTDIMDLAMGYQTLVGEMGGSLSGGQKQRLLLARALYKNPKLLILDEATSHLDVTNEREISKTLRELGIPILQIAHRPETIAAADRVISLEGGRIAKDIPEPV